MVPPQEEEVERVFEFIRHQQAKTLKGFFSPIYIITQEEIAPFVRLSHTLEDTQQIFKLSVNVSANDDWRVELEQHGLTHE